MKRPDSIIVLSKHLLRGIFFWGVLLIIGTAGHAKEVPTVTFTTGEWPPFISKNLEEYGIVTRIVTEACNRAGIKPVYKFVPWKRASKSVKDGKYVGTFSWNKTAERMKDFLYSAYPVNKTPNAVFYKKSEFPNGVKFHDLSDLATYKIRIAGIRGYWYEEGFKKLGIKLFIVNRSDQAWKLLKAGRVTMYVDALHVGFSDAKRVTPELMNDLGYTEYGSDDPYIYIMYSPTHKDTKWVKSKIDKALKSIHEDGTFDRNLETLLQK